MKINGFDPGVSSSTWSMFIKSYGDKFCYCKSAYDYSTIDVMRRRCRNCHKPPWYLLRKCVSCSDVWVHHGVYWFFHPAFCVQHPMCFDCCSENDPCDCSYWKWYNELNPDKEITPPQRRKAKLAPGENPFDF